MAHWRPHLLRLGLTLAALLAIFRADALDMARIWWSVSTYNHCLFVLPIAAWLIREKRDAIAAAGPPQPWLPGVALVFLFAGLWVLGEAGGIAVFRHLGLVLILLAAAVTLLGLRIARIVAFPLGYLLFLVPAGDGIVPLLQQVTARMATALLDLFAVPATLDGVFIATPVALFEVAEACAGVNFLIAMIAYGTLAGYLCFRSIGRRFAFVIACVAASILANAVRAFLTILVSYRAGNTDFAEGLDHVAFGWIVFALVMVAVTLVGRPFFDRRDVSAGPRANAAAPPTASGTAWPMPAAVLAAALLPVGWDAGMSSRGRLPMPHRIALPAIAGWERVPIQQSARWLPDTRGADHHLVGQYADRDGNRVDVVILLFSAQEEGRELVGYGRGALDLRHGWSWIGDTNPPVGGRAMRIVAAGVEREAFSFYRVDGMTSGNPQRVKISTVLARLAGRDQAAFALHVSAENRSGQPARPVLERFMAALSDPAALAGQLIKVSRRGPSA